MFRTKCAIISPTWTLSCQRPCDLCRPSPGLFRFRENRSHQVAAADTLIEDRLVAGLGCVSFRFKFGDTAKPGGGWA